MRVWLTVFATTTVVTTTHPDFDSSLADWTKFRKTFKGGKAFVNDYLERFSTRENWVDFGNRKRISYCAAHAKAAILDIKNAIYQRMVDIKRADGPESYMRAISGEDNGVDYDGNSMTGFIGRKILPELLTLAKVGIFVDKDMQEDGISKTEARLNRPYIYMYKAEEIRSWTLDAKGRLIKVLLKDTVDTVDKLTGLTDGTTDQYRLLTKSEGTVEAKIYDKAGTETSSVILNLPEIPFVILELSGSLLEDVADYQIAMTNLASADMNYAMKSNFPFYTEQYNPAVELTHLRQAVADTSSKDGEDASAQVSKGQAVDAGSTQGRRYPKGLERPGFINPSPEPLEVSMKKQDKLKAEIRELVNLAVSTLEPRVESADSKKEDSKSLEAGLSYIGMELEYGEKKIAEIWSAYEGTGTIAVIAYPRNYSLKTDGERLDEAKRYREELPYIPSISYQREVAKEIVNILIGYKVSTDQLAKIYAEIEAAPVVVTDPEVIAQDIERGLVSTETASRARLYPVGEVAKAKVDHAERLARIQQAQTDPANRGDDDRAIDTNSTSLEKEGSRNTDKDDVPTDKTRGEGK